MLAFTDYGIDVLTDLIRIHKADHTILERQWRTMAAPTSPPENDATDDT